MNAVAMCGKGEKERVVQLLCACVFRWRTGGGGGERAHASAKAVQLENLASSDISVFLRQVCFLTRKFTRFPDMRFPQRDSCVP